MNSFMRRTMPNEQICSFLTDKQAWEHAIAIYQGPDPLDHWYNYICWYDQNIHGDPDNKFRETLEKCLTIYEHNEYYKQDVRMVKLWMKYIDFQPNPLNLYQILYQRGIGKQCACFYIGWAHYYDSANAFKEAESVYNLGFQAKAEPYAELQQAHTKFRLSISQRMLYNDNSSKKQSANHLNEQRQQITTLGAGAATTTTSTDLQNSATVISSSLNYIYNETPATTENVGSAIDETQANEPVASSTLSNVKLPAYFASYCRNNYEVWKPALFLEEPYDPNRRCAYQKPQVYPGDGEEYSPEEIRAKKWEGHLKQLKEKKEEAHRSHSQVQTQAKPQPQPQVQQYEDIEDQIEASTIQFSTQNAQGTPKSTKLTIKFRKEKPSDSSQNASPSYTIDRTDTPTKALVAGSNGFHPYSCQTSTPKVKKIKKLKIVNPTKYLQAKSSNSNSSDYQPLAYHQQKQTTNSNVNEFDDANLLLSFSSAAQPTTTTKTSASTYREPAPAAKFNDTTATQNGSFSYAFNDNANFSFNESNYADNSNCSVASHVGKLNFRDDYSTYAENSFFAAENDKELKSKRLDKALAIIDTHLAKESIDPFSNELCKAFLTKLDFPSYEATDNMYKLVSTPLPKFYNSKVINLGDARYTIEKEVGRGSYGSVYKAVDGVTGSTVALKYQKPPNIWELYICNEVRKRIKVSAIMPGLMDISSAIIAPNASVLATEFSPFGSLLDINNKLRQATTKVMHESLVMHFSSQIVSIVHHLHQSRIIHADIKPDNFLLMRPPSTDLHYPSLRLIDFGCAIDMTLFPERTQFKKIIQTDGFTCIEMQENRPWSYQTDLFCVAGTVHVMLFGEYMQLQKRFTQWEIKQKLPRYLKKHVWAGFFTHLLNIKDVENLPNLLDMKMQFDEEAMKMNSELQNQIRTLSNLLHQR